MAKSIAEATTKVFEQLQSLPSEERLRVVKAALTLLGEPTSSLQSEHSDSNGKTEQDQVELTNGISAQSKSWIKKNGIKATELEEKFDIDGGKVKLIAGEPIGKGRREQTINTFLLTGVAAYLETGTPQFSDEAARDNCQELGCYDPPNHSSFTKAFGNKITGSKGSGWKLTGPGLAAAAALISPKKGNGE